jgi:peptide/nickel transport system permease protein
MRCLPTSYVENMARQKSMQPGSKSFEEWMAQLTAAYNMDKGIVPGFFGWLGSMLRGDFGDSWRWTVPVVKKFHDTVWLSFAMGSISFLIELLIAIPLGVIAATKQYSKTDYTISVIALAGISLPSFFFASLLKLLFSVKLGWFDLYGLVGRNFNQLSAWGQFLDKAEHLIMPITVLVVVSMGSLMRYTRTNMLEVLNSDYIRTARAKGLSERKVIYHHAFRNTLIPIVTIVGGSLPGLFAGALITEQLFSIPGIGFASYQSMVSGDTPFSMFYLMFLAVLTLLGNLLADILYVVVDPRVRVS